MNTYLPDALHYIGLALVVANIASLILTTLVPPGGDADLWLGDHKPRLHGLLIVIRGALANAPQVLVGLQKILTGQVSKILNATGPTTPAEQMEFALWRAASRRILTTVAAEYKAVGEKPPFAPPVSMKLQGGGDDEEASARASIGLPSQGSPPSPKA